jgi:hypothetical protein
MKKYRAYLFLLLITGTVYAQGEAAAIFLEMQQSPLLFGAGWIGAAIPNTNADGFYLNPAQLGNFSRVNNFSLSFMPQKTDWMPNNFSGSKFNSFSTALGYNFKKENNDLPLSLGIGYIHNKFDYVLSIISDPTNPNYAQKVYHTYDSFDCFSVGASYEYYLLFNLGMSIKSFTSTLEEGHEAKGTAFDFGAMITAPVSKLLFDNYKLELGSQSFIKPKFDFTLGYSLTNVGKKITYIDEAQSDPIPRTARLGYTFDFGFDYSSGCIKNLNVFNYSFTVETEDVLIDRDNNGNTGYQNIFGSIGIKNFIGLKGNQQVALHRGHIFKLLETVIIATGRRNGAYYSEESKKSDAFGLSSEGLFKVLNNMVNNDVIKYITKHFAVEYYNANIFASSFMETNLKGIVLNYRGLEL